MLLNILAGIVSHAALCVGVATQQDAPVPNIVVIISDDAGYSDVALDPRDEIHTPNIDAIGRGGVVFTNGYVTASVCSPSRAGLLTGQYQQRHGHEFNLGGPDEARGLGLPTEAVTIAERLAEAGYKSGMIGKWHLGTAPGLTPLGQGFEVFDGILAGSRSFFALDGDSEKHALRINGEVIEEPESLYFTDWLGERSVRFIEESRDQPFFLYASFTAPHTPMEALSADENAAAADFSEYAPQRRRTYAAMMRSLDRNVGRILDALDRHDLSDGTIVFFINDNGGATNNGSDNGPLRGMKGSKWEGGIRVPFSVRWPAVIPAGGSFSHPVSALDIAATGASQAGVSTSELDGVDLIPYLTGERGGPPHDALFWRRGVAAAVRSGSWKLIRSSGNRTLLFDLSADRGEQHDLSSSHPEVVKRLTAMLEAWEATLAEPGWTEGERWERNQRLKHRMEVRTREQERELP